MNEKKCRYCGGKIKANGVYDIANEDACKNCYDYYVAGALAKLVMLTSKIQ